MRTAPRAIEKAVQFQPETVSSFSQNRCPVWPEYAFSNLLRQDLIVHGNTVLNKFQLQFKGDIEQIDAIELSLEKTAGLMPLDDQYSEWLSGFGEMKEE